MDRAKIVFMIDVNPLLSSNQSFDVENVVNQIQFCTLRILTYFGGKHKLSGRKGSSGPLWGYKFYKSSGGHTEYGNHNLFDLNLKDFENFEVELQERFVKAKEEKRSKKTQMPIAEKLSCVLAEIVAGFQWERPDFFSPVKSRRRSCKLIEHTKTSTSNFVFLFTPCPGCSGDVNYFSSSTPSSASDLQSLLIKEEISRKMIDNSRIAFHWVDVGKSVSKRTKEFHKILSEMMNTFSGALVPIENMSFWWVEIDKALKAQRTSQPAPFSCILDTLLAQQNQPIENDLKTKLSIDVFKLHLTFNAVCSNQEASSTAIHIPVLLRNATIRNLSRSNESQSPFVAEPCHGDTFGACIDDTLLGNGKIIGVFKSSAALSLLQNCKESYHFSFDFSELENENEVSNALKIYQQLLKILISKRLILVVRLNHPENGVPVIACFQPWTNLSGILTIITSPLNSSINEWFGDQRKRENLKLVHGLIQTIKSKLDHIKCTETRQARNREIGSGLKHQANRSATSSFMQSLDSWFCDLPSHCLPPAMHQHIKRLQDLNAENCQRANQRSTELFKKLKDHYKERSSEWKWTVVHERKVSKPEDSLNDMRKLKCRTLSRSAQLIENSKTVKKKKMSEDEIKGKDSKIPTCTLDQVDNKHDHIGEFDAEDDDNVFHDFLKDGQDLSDVKLEDLHFYMKSEILNVLNQNVSSCEATARRLSRHLVLLLNKLNQRKGTDELVRPCRFLEMLFEEISPVNLDESKAVRILRHILRVSMELEIAVLTKNMPIFNENVSSSGDHVMEADQSDARSEKSEQKSQCSDDENEEEFDPVAERVIEQLRPLVFLEDPGFLAKYLNGIILPRFRSKIPLILCQVYESLGQQVPAEIQSPSKMHQDADDSFEMISDSNSVIFSDYGSNNPSNQSAGFRRFASVGDSMALKRQIVVPVRNKRGATKRFRKGYLPERTEDAKANKKIWCRNLFEAEAGDDKICSDEMQPPFGSTKRKLQRCFSEISTSVKDTPAKNQKRHFFWKRQHKQRRKTDGITQVTVIGESPVKDCDTGHSPLQISTAPNLSRSQSFSCKTSPRRFYAPRPNDSMKTGFQKTPPQRRFRRSFSSLSNGARESNYHGAMHHGKTTDHVVPYANGWKTPVKNEAGIDHKLSKEFPELKSNISSPLTRSFSVDSSPLQSINVTHSKSRDEARDPPQRLEHLTRENDRPRPVLDLIDIGNAPSSFGFDAGTSIKPSLYSEDSMDWVAMFGNVHQLNEESPLPTIESVSSYHESETESLKGGGSPNVITPLREGRQPMLSPFLSASSLETLENAPIISPRLRGSRLKRERTCRKRIEIAADD